MLYIHKYPSPIGLLTITTDWENVTWLYIENQKYFPNLENYQENKDSKIFKDVIKWLDLYFMWKDPNFSLPLKPEWTSFRKSVWKILQEIPYWKTTTYWEIAKKLGINGARAIGGAVGYNPISIIVPCHRVIGNNGSITWYAGWVDKKVKLLELENIKVKS
jgi:O-6-methylguanine DNA methyltransferase